MSDATTLQTLLSTGTETAAAIGAPSRKALTHGELRALIARTVARLNELGAGRNDRVAIVLPNGPEMAACFLAVASGTASAPLNPAYRQDEFEFYLGDLNARLLIAMQGVDTPARAAAAKLGVPIVELVPDTAAGAGSFTLQGNGAGSAAASGGFAQPDDVSMVLHTSGTTSRPKIVPLSRATWRPAPPTSSARCSSRPPTAA
jgi:acyl-coenzyme A synthetase/AMP-(fatty) acid ligase